jgi:tetratricopeptide (TPR) repeat protein
MSMRFSAVIVSAFCAGHALAQTPNDYYMAQSTAATAELLRNVESYHLSQGIKQMRDRQPHSAWNDFDFILRYFPNHPHALMLMGSLCEVWRDPKCNMASYLDKAVRLTPGNAGIYLTQGVYLQKRGKLEDAIASYKKSLELNPNSANAHYDIGLAYVATKQYALANEHAQQAYALGMTLPGLQNKLVAAKAWKPIEPKPVEETTTSAEATQPESDQTTPKPAATSESKPSGVGTPASDGSK